jgi:hypothetical protein
MKVSKNHTDVVSGLQYNYGLIGARGFNDFEASILDGFRYA